MDDMNDGWGGLSPLETERRQLKRDAGFIGTGMLFQTLLMQTFFTILVTILAMFGAVSPEAIQNKRSLSGLGQHRLSAGLQLCIYCGHGSAHAAGFFNFPYADESLRRSSAGAGGHGGVQRPIGMTLCVAANFAANQIVNFLYIFGIAPPEYPEMLEPTVTSLILNIFVVAVLPALLEEMVYRGFILQTLRRYGDGMAILVSAILFGLMHGNILQIPFAFLLGLVMGFLVVQTGNIWLAVALHFTNNTVAVLLDYATLNQSTEQANQIVITGYGICAVAGLLALIPLVLTRSPLLRSLDRSPSPLTARERESVLLTSPPFLCGVILYILLTCANIQLVSP